jgi:endonuclease/exonuclease/phosphatase family metal-dependent hydrolase
MGLTKPTFWKALLTAAQERQHLPFVVMGDLNTGDSRRDCEGTPFNCSAEFVALSETLPDAWRKFPRFPPNDELSLPKG